MTACAICPRCGRDQRAAAIFCDACGARMPACGARMPDACRAPIFEPDAGRALGPDEARVLAGRTHETAAPGAAPADVFVGRERELAGLDAALASSLDGKGTLLVLTGEPGIGKTRTAQMFADRARKQGLRVLWGRSPEDPGAPPYWPWRQILRTWLAGVDDDARLQAVLGTAAVELSGLVPEIAVRCPDLPPAAPIAEAPQARFRLFDAVGEWLARIAAERGLMLVLDDLHSADTASLRLLEFVADGLDATRMLLVAIYRDLAISRHHRLSDTLGALARHPRFTRLRLDGLSPEETGLFIAQVTGARPSDELLAGVHARTEGNPLFVAETLRFLLHEKSRRAGDARPADDRRAPQRIPDGVREAIGIRLNRLSPRCNRVLACAAVIGRDFEVRVLVRLMERVSRRDAFRGACSGALDEALAASIIEPLAAPGAWQFRHVLIRDVLYDEWPAAHRARLHEAIATILEALRAAGDPTIEVT